MSDSRLDAIAAQLEAYRTRGLAMFATSSFQTNSVVLLHILSRVGRDVPVCFLNTGFHFPETLEFRDTLAARFGLTVLKLAAASPRSQQRGADGRFLFTSDPDYCCQLNKVEPLEPILRSHDLWINGVRASQSQTRAAMQVEQPAAHGVTRYHPLLGWSARDVHDYIVAHDLPRHPLEDAGYLSVGCRPCTRHSSAMLDDRDGRWFGLNKTECGLHTTLAEPGS